MRVEAARVGQHPDLGATDRLWLAADRCGGPEERHAVAGDPEEGHGRGPVTLHLLDDPRPSGADLVIGELRRGGRGPRHQVGNANPISQEFTLRGGRQVVALYVVPTPNGDTVAFLENRDMNVAFFGSRDAAQDAFYFWLKQIEPVYCDNDDCILLPDGRQVDLQ